MSSSDIVTAVTGLADCFESMNVSYLVGGSVATSVYGVPRATLDVDVVAELGPADVEHLVGELEQRYYIDRDAVFDAVAHHASFNIIHLETMLKVDIFVLKDRPFDRSSFERRRFDSLEDHPEARQFPIAAPEDMVVHKLEWYRLGGCVSERQWLDVLGVLKVQAESLDLDLMRRSAAALGLDDLLESALSDAGIQ